MAEGTNCWVQYPAKVSDPAGWVELSWVGGQIRIAAKTSWYASLILPSNRVWLGSSGQHRWWRGCRIHSPTEGAAPPIIMRLCQVEIHQVEFQIKDCLAYDARTSCSNSMPTFFCTCDDEVTGSKLKMGRQNSFHSDTLLHMCAKTGSSYNNYSWGDCLVMVIQKMTTPHKSVLVIAQIILKLDI